MEYREYLNSCSPADLQDGHPWLFCPPQFGYEGSDRFSQRGGISKPNVTTSPTSDYESPFIGLVSGKAAQSGINEPLAGRPKAEPELVSLTQRRLPRSLLGFAWRCRIRPGNHRLGVPNLMDWMPGYQQTSFLIS